VVSVTWLQENAVFNTSHVNSQQTDSDFMFIITSLYSYINLCVYYYMLDFQHISYLYVVLQHIFTEES